MKALTCEQVRDLLPDRSAAVAQHLSGCPECQAEAALLLRLRATAPAVPAGLDQRIARAARTRPIRRSLVGARQLAMAATLAGAVIGGGILWRTLGSRPAAPGAVPVASGSVSALPVLEDPAVYGGSMLSNLTDAELQSLLTRMQ